MSRVTLILFIVIVLLQGVSAQTKHLTDADNLFESRDYYGAVKLYKKALRKTDELELKQEIALKVALAYYNMNDYSNASGWFEDALSNNNTDSESYIFWSQSLLVEKRYKEALDVLKKAAELWPDDYEIAFRTDAVKKILNSNIEEQNNNIHKVNSLSSDYSDYGIGYFGNSMVITSTQLSGSSRIDGRTGQGYSDLFLANPDDDGFSSLKLFSSKINSPQNDGTFSYDSVNKIGYWTVCSGKPGSCGIYYSDYSESKGWSKPVKAEFMNQHYSYGHPFVSNDGTVVYFTSNMPGGMGGNDIWKIKRKGDGSWGVPVNLGENINTPANEMFPSVYNDTVLFFASNNISSFGGLDLYYSIKNGTEFIEAVNVGLPVNSAADDFNLLLKKNGSGGYFCSNRDIETSDDIYSFKGFPVKINLSGVVVHHLDKKPVAGAAIVVIDSYGECDTVMTDSSGYYSYLLSIFDKYRIVAGKPGYYQDEKVINTDDEIYVLSGLSNVYANFALVKKLYPCAISGIVTDKETGLPMDNILVEIESDGGYSSFCYTDNSGMYIFKELKPDAVYSVKTGKEGYFSESRECRIPVVKKEKVFSKSSGFDMDFQLLRIQKEKEFVLSDIYYDFNKATLRVTSMKELDKLASMLNETPNVVVQISSHTDARGDTEYNMKLSARRATAVVNYLVNKGIDRNRLNAVGYGESRLLIANASTEDEHQANRRTTFQVTGSDFSIWSVSSESGNLEYHLQLLSSSRKRDKDEDFSDIKRKIPDVEVYEVQDAGLFKYEVGARYNFSDARKLLKKLRLMGYSDCFIVCYYDNEKIPVSMALKIEGGR